jgi:hypothetical protein
VPEILIDHVHSERVDQMRSFLRRDGGSTPAALVSLAVVGALTGCGVSTEPVTRTAGSAAAGGQCRFVTAAEVAEAAGIAAVKPAETAGPCNYLLDPADVMPSLDPAMTTFPPIPPAIEFAFYTDTVGVSAVDRDLQRPDVTRLSGLDATAVSFTGPDGEYEFAARTPNGAVRISVYGKPKPPQKFRTDNLTEIARQIFKLARSSTA